MADLKYTKIYRIEEKTESESELGVALKKLFNSVEVNKDPHFFGRTVGNAVEDAVNSIVKDMERGKADSKDRNAFIDAFLMTLSETLKSTKRLYKLRNGE